jgi:hypothetical protein
MIRIYIRGFNIYNIVNKNFMNVNNNKPKIIVESFEQFVENRNLNEGILDWGRDIKDRVMDWLDGKFGTRQNILPHQQPYIMGIANRIVSGREVSEDDYKFFMEQTGLESSVSKGGKLPKKTKPKHKGLQDRHFDYDEMLDLVLNNMKSWVASGGVGMFEYDVILDFMIRWESGGTTWITVDEEGHTPGKRVTLKVRASEENIKMYDELSPQSVFEYYSYGLDTFTLRSFCKDISEQAPERGGRRMLKG